MVATERTVEHILTCSSFASHQQFGGEWRLVREISSDSFLNPRVSSAAFTADDRYLVVGSHERNVKIYDVGTGECGYWGGGIHESLNVDRSKVDSR